MHGWGPPSNPPLLNSQISYSWSFLYMVPLSLWFQVGGLLMVDGVGNICYICNIGNIGSICYWKISIDKCIKPRLFKGQHYTLSRVSLVYVCALDAVVDWISSVHFSRSVVSDSLRPHESQHARPPCPSPTPVQAGFRKGRGTRDQIANICWIMEKAREFQKNIYFCLINYAKAFDCVDHNKLWKILKDIEIPDHLTCLLRNL